MKTCIFVIMIFLSICSFRNITIYGNLAKKNSEQIIIDPIETKIHCGSELGNEKINIIISNSKIKNELKGIASFDITFDNFDSLRVVNIKFRWLRLKDSITNNIIFNSGKSKKNIKIEKKVIAFYESILIPIIKNYKFWIEKTDNKYLQNCSSKNSFSFPFTVKPITLPTRTP